MLIMESSIYQHFLMHMVVIEVSVKATLDEYKKRMQILASLFAFPAKAHTFPRLRK